MNARADQEEMAAGRFTRRCVLLLPPVALALRAQAGVFRSRKAAEDVPLSADPGSRFWQDAPAISIETDYTGQRVANHRTDVRSRWTQGHLYFLYTCQYEALHLKPNPSTNTETDRLWNWDTAEAFLGPEGGDISRYKEFEVSPQGEWVDLDIDRSGQKRGAGVAWNSGFQVKARINEYRKIWFAEMQIPFAAIGVTAAPGVRIRAGIFRLAGPITDRKYISWQVTGGETFHVPERFGILLLED
jgi:hypothetical protein